MHKRPFAIRAIALLQLGLNAVRPSGDEQCGTAPFHTVLQSWRSLSLSAGRVALKQMQCLAGLASCYTAATLAYK